MSQPHIRIVEVGPRDGLQNEKALVPTAVKIELIDRLAATGLRRVEATAFVHPQWVPQMADAADVMAGFQRRDGVAYPVLVPNLQGLERALASGAGEVAVFTAASEAFNLKNTNASIADSLERFRPVLARAAEAGVRVRGYVSTVLGCPYQGEVPVEEVVRVAGALHALGCYEISLGDTIGAGTPAKAQEWKKQYQLADNNIYFYENMAEIAQNPDIDVIYVVTPTYTHRDFAVAAAEAGKHVWCEKPMAMTAQEAQAMIDAGASGVVRGDKPTAAYMTQALRSRVIETAGTRQPLIQRSSNASMRARSAKTPADPPPDCRELSPPNGSPPLSTAITSMVTVTEADAPLASSAMTVSVCEAACLKSSEPASANTPFSATSKPDASLPLSIR